MEASLETLALLIEHIAASGQAQQAAQLANRCWQRYGERLLVLLEPNAEGSGSKAQVASLRFLRAAAMANEELARTLVQRSVSSGSSVVALLSACERPQRSKAVCAALSELLIVLLQVQPRELLTAEHGRLAAAPLRLIEWVPRFTRVRALVAVRRHVLENPALSARTKAPVINNGSLSKLAPLLAGGGELARVAHGFLLRLSAVHAEIEQQRAVDVAAPAGGAAVPETRAGHVALTQLLLALQPTADREQQEVVLAMLSAVPTLRHAYLSGRGDAASLEPRPTRRWVVEVAFTIRVLQTARAPRADPSDTVGARRPAAASLIPPGLGRQFWSRALLHSSLLVRCTALNALVAVLEMLCRGEGTAAPLEAQQELRWVLPDLQTLMTIRAGIAGASSRLASLMHARLLQALKLCKQHLPAVFAEGRLNLERSLGHTLVDAVPLVQQFALQLLLPQQASGTETPRPSSTAQELPAAAELCSLVQMSLHAQHWRTRRVTRRLLVALLESSGTMRGCRHSAATEAAVWLRDLTPVRPRNSPRLQGHDAPGRTPRRPPF